jgi:hypothetical protein
MASVGASAVRIPVKWNLVEANQNVLLWDDVDAAVAAAAENGLRILLNLEGPAPAWAHGPGANALANGTPPRDPLEFRKFSERVAQRYGNVAMAWEIWNEPNVWHYLAPPTTDTYIPLLQAAHDGIRSAGSSAPIITGGTSSDPNGTPDAQFIRELYAKGAQSYFDGLGIHPYTFPLPLDLNEGRGQIINAAQQLISEYGDSGTKIWVTEFGQPTLVGPGPDYEQQAAILSDGLTKLHNVPAIAAVFVFTTVDLQRDTSIVDFTLGLYGYDFTPKPAAQAVRQLVDTWRMQG